MRGGKGAATPDLGSDAVCTGRRVVGMMELEATGRDGVGSSRECGLLGFGLGCSCAYILHVGCWAK